MQLSITQLLIRWRYRRADILIRFYIYNAVSTRQCPSSRSSVLVAPLHRNKQSLWRVLPFTVAAQHQNSSNSFIYFNPLVSLQTEIDFFFSCLFVLFSDSWMNKFSMSLQSKLPNSVTSEKVQHSELRKARVSQWYLLLNPNNSDHHSPCP